MVTQLQSAIYGECITLHPATASVGRLPLTLACLRFKVHDDEIGKDDLAAWACIRLDRLQSGYRFVHLMDAQGLPTHGLLLVKITKDLY